MEKTKRTFLEKYKPNTFRLIILRTRCLKESKISKEMLKSIKYKSHRKSTVGKFEKWFINSFYTICKI